MNFFWRPALQEKKKFDESSCLHAVEIANKKRLAIRHMNKPLCPMTLSILSYDIGKCVGLRTYQHPLVCVCVCVCVCVYIHTHIHTYVHTSIHTWHMVRDSFVTVINLLISRCWQSMVSVIQPNEVVSSVTVLIYNLLWGKGRFSVRPQSTVKIISLFHILEHHPTEL